MNPRRHAAAWSLPQLGVEPGPGPRPARRESRRSRALRQLDRDLAGGGRNTRAVTLRPLAAPLPFRGLPVRSFDLVALQPPRAASRASSACSPGPRPWTARRRRRGRSRRPRPTSWISLGQPEQRQRPGDRALPDLEPLGELALREPAARQQRLEGPGLLDRPQVLAEAVLDELVLQQVLGAAVARRRRRRRASPARRAGRPASGARRRRRRSGPPRRPSGPGSAGAGPGP